MRERNWSIRYPLFGCLLGILWAQSPVVVYSQVVEEWVVRHNGNLWIGDIAYAIALDSTGNVYVTGLSAIDTLENDCATVKYDINGNELWVAWYDGQPESGFDQGLMLVVDVSGNVYVTGISQERGLGSPTDYFTIKYDSAGNELWVARYNGPGDFTDIPTALALDSYGNVYVTGRSWGHPDSFSDFDYATVKYDSSGNELWVARYNGPGNYNDYANDLVVDTSENVYVTGSSAALSLDPEATTIKYDSSGNEVWILRDNEISGGNALALDSYGDLYLVRSTLLADINVIKYNSDGIELKQFQYDGGIFEGASNIVLDPWDNVIVAGRSEMGINTVNFLTVKFDTSGNSIWARIWNGPADDDDILTGLAIDPMGNIAVTGRTSDGDFFDPMYDYATVKYDSDGNQLWDILYNGLANDDDQANGVVMDDFGTVYVTGFSHAGSTTWDYTTIKYSDLVGVEETEKIRIVKNPFFISPNPFWSLTTIQGRGEFKIYDISGRLRGKIEEGPFGQNLESGVYFIQQGETVVKVIKIQ